ncbi:cilia- and flagella-associated protein 97-like [Physella acuta]|uniref:cilia- and flagella-associated protein 97-like n=1 Tax=Physella acuta TaxID=109671 RepID=UPI0027DEAAA8|nr:cilia- and flagella-associated protein 97-like [Physella acuta]
MESLDVNESVDFDFFETPRSPLKEDVGKTEAKPPVRPKSAQPKPSPSNLSKDNIKESRTVHDQSDSDRDYSSDSVVSDDDDESVSHGQVSGRKSRSSKSSVSVSSHSDHYNSSDSESSRSHSELATQSPARSKSGRSPSSGSESDERPSNPVAKGGRHSLLKKETHAEVKSEDSSSSSSEGEERARTKNKKQKQCEDDGDRVRSKKTTKQGSRALAWSEGSIQKHKSPRLNQERPKTAKNRSRASTREAKFLVPESVSDSLSESDMTDVSPIESPRNGTAVRPKQQSIRVNIGAAGDSHTKNPQYKAELDLKELLDADDPDRQMSSYDLNILMTAVSELEKQKRLAANSRRVMFAPIGLKRAEKANYTFDDNKARDIERENSRLLKEIVRRVSDGDQRKSYVRRPITQKLTPSAINREKEIRRIEADNLAFLKRLKQVKPTKAICRENQLKEYHSTLLHGIPISSLHPPPRAGHRSVMDDSASSMTSIQSATSTVRSLSSTRSGSSRMSSRPSSAKRAGSSSQYFSRRPEWSDRW